MADVRAEDALADDTLNNLEKSVEMMVLVYIYTFDCL